MCLGDDYFLYEIVNKELKLYGLGDIRNHVNQCFHADNEQYQNILLNEVIFNSYVQPSGSNLISEAISAGTSLLLNRHDAFIEYLGKDYPLFYDDTLEASNLINKLLDDDGFVLEVSSYMKKIEEKFSIEQFIKLFTNISEYTCLNDVG